MSTIHKFFQYISYLGLPFMFGSLYFIYEPIITGDMEEYLVYDVPTGIIIIGFGMTLLSFRDSNKSNKLDRWLMDHPVAFKIFTLTIMVSGIVTIILGIYLVIAVTDKSQLGIGLASFGLGYLGLIKLLVDQVKDLTEE